MADIRKEAYNIILKVLKDGLFSDKLLKKYSNKLNNEEKKLLYNFVKGTIKQKGRLEYIATLNTDPVKFAKTDLKIKILVYLALYQLFNCDSIPDYAVVDESVKMAKKLYGDKIANFINALLRGCIKNPSITIPEKDIQRIAYGYSFPEYLVEKWIEQFGLDDTELLCIYFNEIPMINLRVNSIATTPEKLYKYFYKKNVFLKKYDDIPNIFYSEKPEEILNDVALQEGYFSIQDCSASLVVNLLDPQPNESIIDFFAGPGGKVSYIAELMKNTGEIVAVDKSPQKIKKVKKNLNTLQLNNTILVIEDFQKFGPKAPAYHRVLLDVPCSGWGVLQKKPELRWQINQDMKSLLKLQENALNYGSLFVKPGGILVYSTCTINNEENEFQIEKFLAKHKDFELVDPKKNVPEKYIQNKFFKTIPHLHNMDGAFAAKMQRKA